MNGMSLKTEIRPAHALRWVAARFAAYRKMTKGAFLWRITLEGLVMPFVLVVPFILIFDLHPRPVDFSDVRFLFAAVIIAPVFETILCQTFPVMLARRLGAGFWTQVVAGMGLFAALHFPLGVAAGLAAGVVSGFYFSFTYVHWRQESLSAAVWMTVATHSLHNLVLCGAGFAGHLLSA